MARVARDVDWRHAGGPEIPYGGNYRGRDGVGEFFTRIGAAHEVLSWEPEHVLAAGGDGVVATGAWSAKAKPTVHLRRRLGHGVRRAGRRDCVVQGRRRHGQGGGGIPQLNRYQAVVPFASLTASTTAAVRSRMSVSVIGVDSAPEQLGVSR